MLFHPQVALISGFPSDRSRAESGVSCAEQRQLVKPLRTGRAYWKQTRKLARSLAAFEKLASLNGTSPPGFMALRQASA